MEYRPFGKTGIEISAIGIGCWEIGGGYDMREKDAIFAKHGANTSPQAWIETD